MARLRSRIRNRLRRAIVGAEPLDSLDWTESLRLLGRVKVEDAFLRSPLPTFAEPASQVCGFDQFLDPAFLAWTRLLDHPLVHHRKLWEYCYILQVAHFHGLLNEGKSALGFGVGNEPLPSALARLGMSVVATDQPGGEAAGSWAATGQHAAQLESVFRPGVVGADEFKRRVTFRSVDMNNIPQDIGNFDLIWSACTIEHLGSPRAGLDFVAHSLSLLRPGGVSVHTTELDLENRVASIDFGNCAIYQASELKEFLNSLDPSMYRYSINLQIPLNQPEDRWVSRAPYPSNRPHLKLELNGALTTSVGIFVRKRNG